jgi:hypothetical protein
MHNGCGLQLTQIAEPDMGFALRLDLDQCRPSLSFEDHPKQLQDQAVS